MCIIYIYIQRQRARVKESERGHVHIWKKVIFKSNEFPKYSYISVAACLEII